MPRNSREQSNFATDIDDLFMTLGEDTLAENEAPTEPRATDVLLPEEDSSKND